MDIAPEMSVSGSGSGSVEDNCTTDACMCSPIGHCYLDPLSSSNITCATSWTPGYSYSSYIAAVEAIFFVIAFFWNLFILISFLIHRKLLKEAASVFLFNLALTDLLLAIFVILQCFITEMAGTFIIGHTDILRCRICEFLGFMMMFLMSSNIHTLAMLSLDRFILLSKPLSYKHYFTWKRAIGIVCCIWVLSFLLALPPIFGFGAYGFSRTISNCLPQWFGVSSKGINNIYFIAFISIESLIPILFLSFTNMWTYKIVTRVLKTKLIRQKTFSDMETHIKASESNHNRQQIQLVKVFSALFLAHIVCWVPVLTVMTVIMIGREFDPSFIYKIPRVVFTIGWLLYLTNPVVHPILETFFVKELRSRVNQVQETVRRSLKRVGSSFIDVQNSTKSKTGSVKKQKQDSSSKESGNSNSISILLSPIIENGKFELPNKDPAQLPEESEEDSWPGEPLPEEK